MQSGLIFAFAFLLYANTLTHGFVLDDSIVISHAARLCIVEMKLDQALSAARLMRAAFSWNPA